jgi:hypothetical protein
MDKSKVFTFLVLISFAFGVLLPYQANGRANAASSGWLPLNESPQTEVKAWVNQCVDCPKLFKETADRALVLDKNGRPHIAYGGDHLYYAWQDGAGWQYSTVDASTGVGRHASLALDDSGYAHISYKDQATGYLKYARQGAYGWQVFQLIETGDVFSAVYVHGYNTSLALDKAGYAHIAFHNFITHQEEYIFQDASGWHNQLLDIGGVGISLVLDDLGYAHASYYRGANYPTGSATYAYQNASGWHYDEWWGNGGPSGDRTSLVLDQSGFAHIAFTEGSSGYLRLMYASQGAIGWASNQLVEMIGYVYLGAYPSLALDANGNAYISYFNGSSYPAQLKYAYQVGSIWQFQVIGNANDGFINTLSLDSNGYGYIGYGIEGYYFSAKMKYAYQDASGWHDQLIDSARDAGGDGPRQSLAMDGNDRAHIAYVNYKGSNARPMIYASQPIGPGSWQLEEIDTQINNNFSGPSLALDMNNFAHMIYFKWGDDFISSNLRYAYQDATGWHTATIAPVSWNSSGSLALDGSGYAHISYNDSEGLKHLYQDASGWHTQVVDSQGGLSSIKMDLNGYAHISYWGPVPALKYAFQDSAGWHLQSIDTVNASYGVENSLALDEAGNAHISYWDYASNRSLKFAYQDSAGWHTQTIDTAPSTWGGSSLALDKSGYGHISYCFGPDYIHCNLKYAYQDASGWHTQVVNSLGDVGNASSLALDGTGNPRISYHDATNGDLMFTTYRILDDKLYLPVITR